MSSHSSSTIDHNITLRQQYVADHHHHHRRHLEQQQQQQTSHTELRFALVPKQTSSPFFQEVGKGCVDRARVLTATGGGSGNEGSGDSGVVVSCDFTGPDFANADEQAALIQRLVEEGNIDGLAVAITQPHHEPTLQAIALAMERGIPVITFDSDDPTSQRMAYVGTDNFAFREALGKVLLQIDPTGGTYALISSNAPNVKEREDGVRFRLRDSGWIEDWNSPGNCHDNATLSIEQMRGFATSGTKAIIPVGGWPMFNQGAQWSVFYDDHPDILTVAADTLPHQMELLNRNKVGGLVGQIPFQMGVNALDLLLEYHHQNGITTPQQDTQNVIFGTELHEVITVPLDLPPPDIDNHYVGSLRYLGIVLWCIATLAALALGTWTYLKRQHRVVRASQPFFLIMVAVGVLITMATVMPLSFVDEEVSDEDEKEALLLGKTEETSTLNVFVCTSPIWFISIGFTIVFSALFSKTWRINKIFHNPAGFARLSVNPKDVLWPFFLMLSANLVTLSLMTALAPLEYVRKNHKGTDAWNRVISTYGQCESTTDRRGGAAPYLIVLGLINLSVLLVAILQAYQARSIQSEFSESHYIAVTMICILQTIVIAGPVLSLVDDQPEPRYVVTVCAVFIISLVTLGCIFAPKIVNVRKFDARQASKASMRSGSSRSGSTKISIKGGLRLYKGSQEDSSGRYGFGSGSGTAVADKTEGSTTGTRAGSGDNLDNSSNNGMEEGLRFWRSQVSEIEPTGSYNPSKDEKRVRMAEDGVVVYDVDQIDQQEETTDEAHGGVTIPAPTSISQETILEHEQDKSNNDDEVDEKKNVETDDLKRASFVDEQALIAEDGSHEIVFEADSEMEPRVQDEEAAVYDADTGALETHQESRDEEDEDEPRASPLQTQEEPDSPPILQAEPDSPSEKEAQQVPTQHVQAEPAQPHEQQHASKAENEAESVPTQQLQEEAAPPYAQQNDSKAETEAEPASSLQVHAEPELKPPDDQQHEEEDQQRDTEEC